MVPAESQQSHGAGPTSSSWWDYVFRGSRLRFLFVAAKIVRHAGAVLVRYSAHYAEQGNMGRLMDRLRKIVRVENHFAPVLLSPLRL